jgi:hypothetical protein
VAGKHRLYARTPGDRLNRDQMHLFRWMHKPPDDYVKADCHDLGGYSPRYCRQSLAEKSWLLAEPAGWPGSG